MKTILALTTLAIIGLFSINQISRLTGSPQAQRQQMTHQELFSQSVEALSEIRELQWSPSMDYKYRAAFTKAESLTLNDLNEILAPLLKKRDLEFSKLETGDRSSQGSITAQGLANYYVDIEYSQYAISLTLRGTQPGEFYLGGLISEDRKKIIKPYSYKSLGEASRDIMGRLIGGAETIKNRVDCTPSSEHVYCITTTKSAQDILNWFIDTYSPSDRSVMEKGYANQAFQFTDKTEITKSLYVSIDFKKLKTLDKYLLWDSDYKRKNFTITYMPSSKQGKNLLRVEASWVDGYTPSPEEK